MCEGVFFPSMHAMVARWLPIKERGLMSTLVYSGAQIGTVWVMPLTGLMATSKLGWESAFYLQGALGIAWFAAWMYLVHETPQDHPRISRQELKYILDGQGEEKTHKNAQIPWKKVLTSVPVWAVVSRLCN